MSSNADKDIRPSYFSKVQEEAKRLWDQLESNPVLAGPWYQLFKQVQSPRHVLSELLQNAEDAGAKNVTVRIVEDEFVFEHDGEDFDEEQFTSLCRFGFSNKRNLRTIGFRGVGFKSTFSLGDDVRLLTPTLSVSFNRKRFTEPIWLHQQRPVKTTKISVFIKGLLRQQEFCKNLVEWAGSPLSLLFFHNIQRLQILDKTIHRHVIAPGPVKKSEWVKLDDGQEEPYLLISSELESFPKEALDEIRQERMSVDNLELPPCQIDILIGPGIPQQLFVVLPTEVKTTLPFACNAPFVQDPARMSIKDPETSPTNRWLLQRAGHLAAQSMITWLQRENIEVSERCKAYMLLPDINRYEASSEDTPSVISKESFDETINGKRFLITDSGNLAESQNAIAIPTELYDIWAPDQISLLLNQRPKELLCRHVSQQSRDVLIRRNLVSEISKSEFVDSLEQNSPPKPQWRQLLLLWDFVEEEVTKYRYSYHNNRRNVRIVPVQGKEILYSASEVIRLGEKKLLPWEDWDFLASYTLVLNQYWPRFIAEQRLVAEEKKEEALGGQVANADEVLARLSLDETSSPDRLIAQIAPKFFNREEVTLEDCVHLTQIAANLGATVPEDFQFVTVNGCRTPANQIVVADVDNDLDLFLDEGWRKDHQLHESYGQSFTTCTKDKWNQWVESERSQLFTFVPIQKVTKIINDRKKLGLFLVNRECSGAPTFHYKTNSFEVQDWDFDEKQWDYWKTQASRDTLFWVKLFIRIVRSSRIWEGALYASIYHIATTGSRQRITNEELLPSWIMKFRTLPCLLDTHDTYREPAELLRRTPYTEPLLDVEPFVRAEYDTERSRPLLVKLGVRDTPTGPEQILNRLDLLARAGNAPIYEIEKWYHRLDQLLVRCTTDELQKVKGVFADESLILTDSGVWAKSKEVFIDANLEDVSGAATVHPSVRHLALWHKVGIADRPTIALVLEWLEKIPSGSKLLPDEVRRVRPLLSRNAIAIWQQCQHWLNLEGEWTPTEQLKYKITMQSLVPWTNLFPAAKSKTANLQDLSAELCGQHPFDALTNLAECIEERISQEIQRSSSPEQKTWMQELGKGFARVIFDDQQEIDRVRQLGRRLAETSWWYTKGLKATPYIDGSPVGTARKMPVAWNDRTLYVEHQELTSLIRDMVQELARPFGRQDISDAIKICVEREGGFVTRYLESNFKMAPQEQVIEQLPTKETEGKPPTDSDDTEGKKAVEEPQETIVGRQPQTPEEETPAEQTEIVIRTKKPQQPRFIEIFAKMNSYEKDGDSDCFYHSDGSSIRKSENGSFQWEKYSRQGDLMQSYWLKEHCLQKSPLQLDAVVCESCQDHPDKYTLVLIDPEGKPTELSGHELQKLVKSGKVKLYPAEYRLAYEV